MIGRTLNYSCDISLYMPLMEYFAAKSNSIIEQEQRNLLPGILDLITHINASGFKVPIQLLERVFNLLDSKQKVT